MAVRRKTTKKASKTGVAKAKAASRSRSTRKASSASAQRSTKRTAKSKTAARTKASVAKRGAKSTNVKKQGSRGERGLTRASKRAVAASVRKTTTKPKAAAASPKLRAKLLSEKHSKAPGSNTNQVEAKLHSKIDRIDEKTVAVDKRAQAKSAPNAVAGQPKAAASQKVVGAAVSPPKPDAMLSKEQKPHPRQEASGNASSTKAAAPRQGFKLNEFVVYPAHGVGQIVAVEEQEVAGFRLELFVISFSKDKMILRVPTSKVTGVGLRKISDADTAKRSLEILTGRARVKRTMWSRRAQEYETKINSGDIGAIAEVVRDLYRSEAQPEQSYSERQLYEAALDRMVREIAAVQKSNEIDALKAVEAQLQKGLGRSKPPAAPADASDSEIEEAA
jgi:CarD family transcriptional regulator